MKFPPVLSLSLGRMAVFGFIALLGLSTLTPDLLAQEVAAPVAGARPAETLLDILKHSGPVVWVCMALSVVVTTFTIEGFLKLRIGSLAPPEQVAKLRELIGQYAYQDAWTYCRAHRSFLGVVVAAGLERIGRGKDATEYTLQEVSTQQAVLLKTNSNYLSVIGVVAPMIGLTGTVIGMIKAFKELGASGIGDPSGLAAAIGEVLTATAAGLIVAIPGFVFFYVFKSKAQTAVMLADSAIYRLFEDVPFEQLNGLRVGETAAQAPAEAAPAVEETASAEPQPEA